MFRASSAHLQEDYSCTHAAYGTVTLYGSPWWPAGTQFEFSLKLCTDRAPGILIESDSTFAACIQLYPPEDEHLRLETCRGE